MSAVGRVAVDPRPRECDAIDTNTNRRRKKLVKCEKPAKWRIRVPGTGERVVCDKHRNKGVFLGPLTPAAG